MNLQDLVKKISGSDIADWSPILRPTFRHRFVTRTNPEGETTGVAADQHKLHLTYKKDIRITVGFGMVQVANYHIPAPNPYAEENARTHLLDCYWEGRLAFRDIVVNVGRNRCLLPLPAEWTEDGMEIPVTRYGLVRLIHEIAGPPTDFDEHFTAIGMQRINRRWP